MILTESKLKRAIQSCRNKIKHHYEYTQHKKSKAIENELTKIEALKKQIPKKPILDKEQTMRYVMTFTCPTCGKGFTGTKVCSYCYHCGQALDWSDAE